MTDKEEIKFAIRYLKKGLKSKRTPPLYEELMNELGFTKNEKLNNLAKVAEVRLANWKKYKDLYNKAKDLIQNIIRVTWNEGWNYDLGWKIEAEKFLEESE